MQIVKWAAVAVTALFALMNLGTVPDGDIDTTWRVVGAVMAVAGLVAAIALATNQAWGRAAIIVVGGINVIAAVVGLFTDEPGAVIGIVVGGLGVVLGALSGTGTRQTVRA
jgi:hypothetical protein